jgi:hypothetical protein
MTTASDPLPLLALIEKRTAPFTERACAAILAELSWRREASGESLVTACKAAGVVPTDDRHFGPAFRKLAMRGQIVRVGEVKRKRGHGAHGGSIWAICADERMKETRGGNGATEL